MDHTCKRKLVEDPDQNIGLRYHRLSATAERGVAVSVKCFVCSGPLPAIYDRVP